MCRALMGIQSVRGTREYPPERPERGVPSSTVVTDKTSGKSDSFDSSHSTAALRLPAAGRADGYVIFNGGDPGRSPGGVHRLIMLGPRVGRAM